MVNQGSIGNAILPFTVPTNSISEVADPLKQQLVTLFTTAIRTEIETAWAAISPSMTISGSVVKTAIGFDPVPALSLEINFGFPLLAVFEESSKMESLSLETDTLIRKWKLTYVLPPLTALGVGKLEDVRSAVSKVIAHVFMRGSHRAYNDGYSLSDLGIISLDNYKSENGRWEIQNEESLTIQSVLNVTFETTEIINLGNDIGDLFDGVNFTVYNEDTDLPFAVVKLET